MMKPPKKPRPPKQPTSPLDNNIPVKNEDSTSVAYKSLISGSPMGQTKPAFGTKKTLLGGTK